MEGVIARMTKDDAEARAAFTAARAEQEKDLQTPRKLRPGALRAGFDRRCVWDGKRKRCGKAGGQLSFFRWKKMQLTESLWSNTSR